MGAKFTHFRPSGGGSGPAERTAYRWGTPGSDPIDLSYRADLSPCSKGTHTHTSLHGINLSSLYISHAV